MRPRYPLHAVGVAGLVCAVTSALLSTATPAAAAAVTCTSPVWKAQFYSNTTFKGTPKLTSCDSTISENYGTGDPAGVTLPRDNFAVRWSVSRDFGSGGPFTFSAAAQDGVRVYVDNVRRIDLWKNVSSTRSRTVNLTIPSGSHTLRVDFVAWTGSANVKFSYTPRTTAAVDKVRPLAPAKVTGRLDNATAKAVVSWARNKEMDLADYRVYRRTAGSTAWAYIGRTAGTTFAHLPGDPRLTYYYEVRAYDKAGNASSGSADVPVTGIAVAPPAELAAQGLDSGNKLSWRAVPGAVKYSVERRATDGSIVFLGATNATGYTDSAAPRSELRTYLVRSIDGAGRYSGYAAAEASRPVAAPHEVTARADANRAALTWKIDPATDGDHYGFHVYRSTSLPVDTSGEPVRCDYRSTRLPDGRKQYSCTDSTTASRTTYHYVVKGYDNGGKESVASDTATVTTLVSDRDETPPTAVAGFVAEARDYGIVLDWKANTEPDLAKYAVYIGRVLRDEDSGEAVCSGSLYTYVDKSTTHYVHPAAPDGAERCFWLDAVDTSGNSHWQWTREAEARIVVMPDLTPTVPTPPGSPVHLSAGTGAQGAVTLAWNAVEGATGYRVYRWDRVAGQYAPLTGDDPYASTSYTDTTASPGTTHFYWVKAVLPDGTETGPGAVSVALPPTAG
ncbi:PA14 domain-containing protein [Streptomyces sp. NBC_00178]|uniref:PA14 domain-containing protein n=1 Tax=Streptomyces sp. NBC_00178 TaxID=2975672 RepID=UPI002E2CAB7F|nr:PA14 domain-containing protein [Streptomyces sp. NBC_00178]